MFLVLLVILSFEGAKGAVVHKNTCDADYPTFWPPFIPDNLLTWVANEQTAQPDPKFRLVPEENVSHVEPDTEYRFALKVLDSNIKLSRFLIMVDSFESDTIHEIEKCHEVGSLKSLSDKSQHVSYQCSKYLADRSDLDAIDVKEIPFSWYSPKCGCFQISAEVLDDFGQIYTRDSDQYNGLLIQSCVGPSKMFDDDKFENSNKTVLIADETPEADEVLKKVQEMYREDAIEETLRDGDTEDQDAVEEHLEVDGLVVGADDDDAAEAVKELMEASRQLDEKEDQQQQDQDAMQDLDLAKLSKKKRRKLRRQRRRKNASKRKRGHKYCCKKGLRTKVLEEDVSVCLNVPENVLSKAESRYKLRSESCSQTFEKCCEDKRFGKKMIRIIRKLDKYKYLERKLRRHRKGKKSKEVMTTEAPEEESKPDAVA